MLLRSWFDRARRSIGSLRCDRPRRLCARPVAAVESLEDRTLLSVQFLFDYSYDTAGFFDEQARRDVLALASDQLGRRLYDSLLDLTADASNTWTATFNDPATGNAASEVDLLVSGDTLVVFAGARDLPVGEVGNGGHGGFTASGDQAWIERVAARGQDGALLPAPTDFGPWGGSITFDTDTSWHFGATTVGLDAGESDFLSVAIHELGHLLGITESNASWTRWIVEGEFEGPASLDEFDGFGNVPLESDGAHWGDGVTESGQEVAMDSSLDVGTRKQFTELDFAGLVDLGWNVLPGIHTIDVADGLGHSIVIEDDPIAGDSRSRVTIDGGVPTTFVNPADTLVINGADGDDTITFNGLDSEFAAAIVFNGQAGNDTLSADAAFGWSIRANGGVGDDSFVGGTGNDTLNGDAGADELFGGEGNDELNGGDAADRLAGGPGDDVLNGQAGDGDMLLADAGDDTLDGGAGIDRLIADGDVDFTLTDLALAGMGTDVLAGLEEARLSAGAGDNLLDATGFSGNTTLLGAAGADTLRGGSGVDLLVGNAGKDTLEGNGGADKLLGGSGADWLNGGDGADILKGQGGSMDSLTGGPGDDSLDGGPGNDWVIDGGDVDLVLIDTLLTGAGSDLLFSVERATLAGGDLANTFDASGFTGNVTLLGGGGNDTLLGGSGVDLLNGNAGDDSLSAGGGNDRVFGGAGNDWLDGGDGNDRLKGHGGNSDTLRGGPGNDVLHGGSGTGDRAFESFDGNMVLIDGELLGVGTDTLVSIDVVELVGGPSANRFNASAYTGDVVLRGGGGNDTLLGGAGADLLVGNAGDDQLSGAAGKDRLFGGSGGDLLDGGAGNDLLRGQSGDGDRLTGGLGNDTLRGGPGNDRIVESADTDFVLTASSLVGLGTDSFLEVEGVELTGGAGANSLDASTATISVTLIGGDGNDTLRGGAADDLLEGLAGDDLLDGGGGSDTARAGGNVDFTLTDTKLLGAGDDTLAAIERAELTGGVGNNTLDATLFSGQATLRGGLGDDTLRGGSGDDSLDGGGGNDAIAGRGGNDKINGGAGNDTAIGQAGNDTLIGGAGDDWLLGGDGDDTVKGQAGTDRICGGDGNDLVVGSAAEIDECFGDCFADWCPDI